MEPSALSGPRRAVAWFSTALFALGTLARGAPLLDHGGRLLRQFPTEDGYLMLTLARNLALGHGMSTAEGTIPSNGTQPLATVLWAALYACVGGDKQLGVASVLVVELLFAVASAWLIRRLALRVLDGLPDAPTQATLAAAVWYANSTVVKHSMNCLETGLYGLTLVSALLVLFRPLPPSPANAGVPQTAPLQLLRWAFTGAVLGLSFWARNDAVLLCGALSVVHLGWGLPGAPASFARRFLQLSVAGSVVAVIAAPWLLFNLRNFGSIVPISGQSEAMDAAFGSNLAPVLPSLFEYLNWVVPVPQALSERPWVLVVTGLGVGGALAVAVRALKTASPRRRAALRLGLAMTLLYVAFYGLYFGASHFMSRYLFALTPLLCIGCSHVAYAGLMRFASARAESAPFAMVHQVLVAAWVVCAALLAREYQHGDRHQHFQVVEWVQHNVSDATWVGAIQTGTLGYFHDRTINLDGKVNPHALEARKQHRVPEYVSTSGIQYLVDWQGITGWLDEPAVAAKFELVTSDPEQNLGVLKRKARPVDVADVLLR